MSNTASVPYPASGVSVSDSGIIIEIKYSSSSVVSLQDRLKSPSTVDIDRK